jgi:hypothetical protein
MKIDIRITYFNLQKQIQKSLSLELSLGGLHGAVGRCTRKSSQQSRSIIQYETLLSNGVVLLQLLIFLATKYRFIDKVCQLLHFIGMTLVAHIIRLVRDRHTLTTKLIHSKLLLRK